MKMPFKNTWIHYTVDRPGQGPWILAVHGFTENLHMWDELPAMIPEKFSVLRPDLLGHGQSGLTGEYLTMEEQAEMLRHLLDWQGIDRAVLVGHSMGGYIALAFTEMYPERTAALLLYHSKPQADDPAKAKGRDQAIAAARQNKFAYLQTAIPGFFAPYNRDKYAERIHELVRQAFLTPVEGITGALRGMKIRKDRRPVFYAQDDIPKGWIVGRDDPLIDFDALEAEARQHPHVQFLPIEGGHMSYVENRPGMEQALRSFLENLNL